MGLAMAGLQLAPLIRVDHSRIFLQLYGQDRVLATDCLV
jgi:hypothetical protein